jgi:hypothetical protein
VEVRAIVVTCVEGRPAGCASIMAAESELRVWTIVPSYILLVKSRGLSRD